MKPEKAEEASPAASIETPDDAAAATAAQGESQGTDANAADSSAAGEKDAKAQPSLADVVRNAVEQKPAEEGPSASEGDKDQKAPEGEEEAAAAADAEAKDPDAEVPFHNHPRWQQLLRERKEFEADATNYRGITSYMDAHGLAPEEVGEGFEVMAKLKSGDPAQLREVLDWFEPRVQFLRETLGVTLPPDLQTRVDDGLLDADTAKELAEARATEALRVEHDQARADAAADIGQAEQRQATVLAAATAVDAWEKQIKATDPDYPKKAELVQATVMLFANREGIPATPEAAVAMTKRAYEQVNASFKGMAPRRSAVDTTTPAGSSSAPSIKAPATLREAIEQSLEG